MLPNDTDFLIWKERHKDFQREAEHERLIGLVKLQQPNSQQGRHVKLLGWIGGQLIQWGLKLQQDKQQQGQNLRELAENTD